MLRVGEVEVSPAGQARMTGVVRMLVAEGDFLQAAAGTAIFAVRTLQYRHEVGHEVGSGRRAKGSVSAGYLQHLREALEKSVLSL